MHYSVQRNHLHLLVESAGKEALGRGMKAISARVARAAQRAFGLRGPVLHGRYHLRILRTPREVRSALAYVLNNARKHGLRLDRVLDVFASGWWFEGWQQGRVPTRKGWLPERPTANARSWLLNVGWRRHGRIGTGEVPAAS